MLLVISVFYYYVIEANWATVFYIFPLIREFIVREWVLKINGILFYVPMIYATIVFGWRGTLAAWIISLAIIFPHLISYTSSYRALFNNIILLSIPLLIVAYIVFERKWRNKEKRVASEREAERQKYLAQIFKVQEDERIYIAQEIHDDSLQQLAIITSKIQDLIHDEDLDQHALLKSKVVSIKDMIVAVSGDLRKLSMKLRPKILDDLGLVSALKWQVEHFQQDNNITAEILISGKVKKIPETISDNVFRIVQEALNNVKKHAQASRVNVSVDFCGSVLKIIIKDNGTGFSSDLETSELTNKGKLGIIGMNQRAQFINAKIAFDSIPFQGTSVILEVKLNE
jgi:two-component system, NarL family, sensor histidine kinase DegS